MASRVSALLSKQPFSIYIHWPYCETKCTYCNFNKYVNPANPPHERMRSAICTELAHILRDPRYRLKGRTVNSVYFGGGTPSLALPTTLQAILDVIDKECGLPSNVEITMEANPTSVETKLLSRFRDVGINRLSLGIQSFNDKDLTLLGRDHSGKQAIRSLEEAKRVFQRGRVTFDLIFARPGQSVRDWEQELERALKIADDHISLYQLTIERSTPIYKAAQQGSLPPLPTVDEASDMYETSIKMTASHGFAHYEVSNYARDQVAISRHNFGYWRGLDYIGVGPGAHGRLYDFEQEERIRTYGEFHPNTWMAQCEEAGHGIRNIKVMTRQEMIEEIIVFGLRTRMGVPQARFSTYSDNDKHLKEYLDPAILLSFISAGFLEWHNPEPGRQSFDRSTAPYVMTEIAQEFTLEGGLRPTEKGLAVADELLPRLLRTV